MRFDRSDEPVCTQGRRALFSGASQGSIIDGREDGESWIESGCGVQAGRVGARWVEARWVEAAWVGAGSWAGFGIAKDEGKREGRVLGSFGARLRIR
jgi:hypothetical protein